MSVFYREADRRDAPAIVLLHGFPSSSRMWQPQLDRLAGRFHLVAPDYPGFEHSDAPAHTEFAYTFDHVAAIVGQVTQGSRAGQVHPCPAGLRRPGRIAARDRPSRAARSAHRAERRRPRGRARPTVEDPARVLGRPQDPRGRAAVELHGARRAARHDRGPDQQIPATPPGSHRWLTTRGHQPQRDSRRVRPMNRAGKSRDNRPARADRIPAQEHSVMNSPAPHAVRARLPHLTAVF